jgi:chaperonin cofactor prefoldin
MVIHDLKHPTESMISQLETLETQLSDHAQKLQEVRLSLPEDLRNSQKLVF